MYISYCRLFVYLHHVNIDVFKTNGIMKKYCLTVGDYVSETSYVIEDLLDVNQLFGAMRAAVDSGHRLINVYVDGDDL